MSEIVKQTDLIDKISAQYKPYIEALLISVIIIFNNKTWYEN